MNLHKESILKNILSIFECYGIRSMTIESIAQKIQISKREIGNIGKTKETLIQEIFTFRLKKSEEDFQEKQNNKEIANAIDELLNITIFMHKNFNEFNPQLDFEFKKYYPILFAKYDENKNNSIIQKIIQNLERGKREAYYKYNLDLEGTALNYFEKNQGVYIQKAQHKIDYKTSVFEKFESEIKNISNMRGIEYYESKAHILETNLKEEINSNAII